jgi:LemA protein
MVVALIVFCVIASVAILLSVAVYNSVVRKDARADAAADHIQFLTVKQGELVSQLVSSVRVYGAADDRTIVNVEHRLREAWAAKGTGSRLSASEALKKATAELVEEARGCQEAMASTSFTELVAEVEAGDEEIARARADFVDCVDAYNDALAAFPASIICGPRFRPRKGGTPRPATDATDATVGTDAMGPTDALVAAEGVEGTDATAASVESVAADAMEVVENAEAADTTDAV